MDDLVRCWVPGCDEVAWEDGPEGIVPHILREHPDSAPGRTIRAELLRDHAPGRGASVIGR